MTKRERLNKIAREIEGTLIEKYGTSEGAMAAWDTRGRGRKAPEKKEPKSTGAESSSWGTALDGSGKKINVNDRVRDQYGNIYTVQTVNPSSVTVKEKPHTSFHPSKLFKPSLAEQVLIAQRESARQYREAVESERRRYSKE